jgi:hypothetical protein
MPYIDKNGREEIDAEVDELTALLVSPGEYNYALTKICQEYLDWLTSEDGNENGDVY